MRLLLISSSTVHGHGYLDHSEEEIRRTLAGVRRVGFVPYAIHDVAPHVKMVSGRLGAMGFETTHVKTARDVDEVEAIFVGGGNSFRLLKALYERELVEPIRRRVRHEGIPYVGSSAGTNVATPSIRTTNDMPIVYPPTFDALGLFPYQVNPHYLDPDPQSTHKGETREQRLLEFLEENDTPVIGLREGSMLRYEDGQTILAGDHPARIFTKGREPYEVDLGAITL